jgi:hypothetical protein
MNTCSKPNCNEPLATGSDVRARSLYHPDDALLCRSHFNARDAEEEQSRADARFKARVAKFFQFLLLLAVTCLAVWGVISLVRWMWTHPLF